MHLELCTMVQKICTTQRVRGGQGCLRGLVRENEPTATLGSSMKRRILNPDSSRFAFAASSRRGAAFRITLLALAALFALSAPGLSAQSANKLFKQGEAAEAHEDYDGALDLYQKALAKSPSDLTYKTAVYRVRVSASAMHMGKGRKLAEGGDEQGALTEFLHAHEVDPSNEAAEEAIDKLRKDALTKGPGGDSSAPATPTEDRAMDSVGGPVILKPLTNEPLTLHYSQDAKIVYQAIGKAAGINVLFDPDYTPKQITVDLTSESLLDALRIVGTLSNTFWRPVTGNTIFVAQNTRQKRTDLEETAVQTFYLTNAWQQNDLTDVQTAIRNVLGSSIKVYGVPSQNAIVIRGTPDELLLSQMLINDLDKARAEVVVDISVLEVSKNWERTLGIAWPSSVGVALQPPCTSSSNCSTNSTTTTTTTTSHQQRHHAFALRPGSSQGH